MALWSTTAPSYAALVLKSLDGQEHLFPNQNQLIFIGSTKKSYHQLQNWFSAVKVHSLMFQQYNIIAVPVIGGLFSSSLFKSGCRALMVTMVPEHHLHRVIPVFEGSDGYTFFRPFQKEPAEELSVILLQSSMTPVWAASGDVTDEKLNSLFQLNSQSKRRKVE